MPAKTAVVAICLTTGNRAEFATIRRCADEGGFEYTSVRNCLHGRAKSHAGHRFEALTPLRKTKTTTNIAKVAALRNKGLSNPEIAKKLGISPSTIPVYASQAVALGLTKTWHEVQQDLAFAKHGL
ncbi:MAG: LuxR C-terminal-related transcriptional regulator [Aeromonas sobria]